jgi:hypothetical protein
LQLLEKELEKERESNRKSIGDLPLERLVETSKSLVSGLENKIPMVMSQSTIEKAVSGELDNELFVIRFNQPQQYPELIPFHVLEKEFKIHFSRVVSSQLRNGGPLPTAWEVLGLERTTIEDLYFLQLSREAHQAGMLAEPDPQQTKKAHQFLENLLGKENYDECMWLIGKKSRNRYIPYEQPRIFSNSIHLDSTITEGIG